MIGWTSASTVASQAAPEHVFGSAPTMLYPYVTPSCGSVVWPNQCATVRPVFNDGAPPTVPDSVNSAWSCASLIVGIGAAPTGVKENAATIAPTANTERPSLRYLINNPSSNTPQLHSRPTRRR